MTQPNARPDPTRASDLREIPKWADRYARHRVLLVLFFSVLCLVGAALIFGLSALAGLAWRADLQPLASVLMVADLAFCVLWVWFWLSPRRQIALAERANRWLYRNEGEVAPAAPPMQPTRLDRVVIWTFGILVFATVIFGFCTDLRLGLQYMQPISAAYVVPFMVYLCYRMTKFSTPVMLLWPGLYALHAILVLAGVPLFANMNPSLSMFLPNFVYGPLAALVSHLYSRYALRRLRNLAAMPEDSPTGGR